MVRVLARSRRAVVTAKAVIRNPGMIEIRRHPSVRGVADLTSVAGWNMASVLTGRSGSIVTAEAVVGDSHVIECRRGKPALVGMAELAVVRRLNMSRVLTRGG